jgi:hypothetical protein
VTVGFAVPYPRTGSIGGEDRVPVMSPTPFRVSLRTIHLGFATLSLEDNAGEIRDLLGLKRRRWRAFGSVSPGGPARSAARLRGPAYVPRLIPGSGPGMTMFLGMTVFLGMTTVPGWRCFRG